MTDLREVIETFDADRASIGALFGDAGASIRARAGRGGLDPIYMDRFAEAVALIARARSGDFRAEYRLREAMTTSDFPLYFGDVIDRSVLQGYTAWTPQYLNYTQRRVVKDFRTANIFAIDGAGAQLDLVPENTEYPAASLAETRYQVSVQKHGRRLPYTWETVVNNDQGLIDDIPGQFSLAARRSEEKDVAKLFVDASGPHATLFSNTNKNIVNTTNGAASNNPVLSISGIQEALKVLGKQVDVDGEPIVFDSLELVVPTALRPTADQIINTTEFRAIDTGSNIRIIRGNGIANALRVSTNPYIATIATTANGATSWFLFATPAPGQRRALIIAFLTGHETPETFIKEPNQRRVGGGGVNPLDGSFETDAIDYKIRHVWGTTRGDPKTAVASNGSGA